MKPQDAIDREAQRAREMQRITNSYHRVFSSEYGRVVLQNLKAYFQTDRPAFQRQADGRLDALSAAVRDGAREVILFIEFKLSQPVTGDSDAKPKTKVIK